MVIDRLKVPILVAAGEQPCKEPEFVSENAEYYNRISITAAKQFRLDARRHQFWKAQGYAQDATTLEVPY
jgi:hypothetical protein